MYSIIHSGGLSGIQSFSAHVEVDVSPGLPGFDMVGKLSKEVREARERVLVSLRNCGIELPPVHITVNISPANIHKTGTAYDLPIAIGILNSLGQLPSDILDDSVFIGELSLDGQVRRVNGVLPIVSKAKEAGYRRCIVPYDNAGEASYVDDIELIPVSTLDEVIGIVNGELDVNQDFEKIRALAHTDEMGFNGTTHVIERNDDFSDIVGQEACKRAALIAAAGFHHLLITGPPGSGKTMIARRIPGIMPPMSSSESLEVSTIYSVSGLLNSKQPYINTRPFQSPHHTTTKQALMGGGQSIRPGVISLTHRGVLFLDEFPEFSRDCIEALREPLEDKQVQVARLIGTLTFPADFMLVASANPCPCGYYPNRNKCNCTEPMIARYRSKISGPMKDRIDIMVASESIPADRLVNCESGVDVKTAIHSQYSSEYMRDCVIKARDIQAKRFAGTTLRYNSDITASLIMVYCPLGSEEAEYMRQVYTSMNLSARSYHKILKVARTIADLDNSPDIHIPHLAEAICYRD